MPLTNIEIRTAAVSDKPYKLFDGDGLHPKVKYWVRNIAQQEICSFWLPTATDYFYPDFVCELTDGRVLAVEYKGEPYKTNDDSWEKIQIGEQWEKTSGGRCLFLMAVEKDAKGRGVMQQIDDKIKGV